MRLPLILLLLIALSLNAQAQDEYHNYGQAYGFSAGQTAWVYADTANVRIAASAEAGIQDRLLQGDSVKITRTGNAFELNGKSAPWCAVSYMVNGARRNGIVWGGLLSPRMLRYKNVRFLYGMRFARTDTTETWVDVKALRRDTVIARTGFSLASTESAGGAHEARVTGTKGLQGLNCLLYFYYSGEACAIPTYELYIGWNGTRFVTLPRLESSGDAGIYSLGASLIFPADKGGAPGMVIQKEQLVQYDDNDKPVHRKTTVTRYRWNAAGNTFVKQ